MRLINVNTRQLTTFDYRETTPRYAILSHTWSLRGDQDEVTFQDIQKGPRCKKIGQKKLDGCCKQAKMDGFAYVWVDTCCIDKANFSELQESLNSMFRWYEEAALCYVYLDDVQPEENGKQPGSSKPFRESRWFRRGWTLQELLAPAKLHFFDMTWQQLGSRLSLSSAVEKVAGIPAEFLSGGTSFRGASVAQRMSWVAKRVTKKPEDIAYCLFGVFDVVIPLHYGEGAERAFVRLQEEIMRRMPSQDDSILAWHLNSELIEKDDELLDEEENRFGPILATRPDAFKESGKIVWEPWEDDITKPITVSGGFLSMQLRLHSADHGETFGLLNCYDSSNGGIVAIPLSRFTPGPDSETNGFHSTARFMRPEGSRAILLATSACQDSVSASCLSSRQIHAPESPRISREKNKRFGFRLEFAGSLENQLKLLEVYPKSRMEERGDFIVTGVDFHRNHTTRAWVRLGHARQGDDPADRRDFVLLLELEVRDKIPYPRCHVMLASRDTNLETLSSHTRHEPDTILGQVSAGTNTCSLCANLAEVRSGGYQSYLVRLEPLDKPPAEFIDVTPILLLRRINLLAEHERDISQQLRNQERDFQRFVAQTDQYRASRQRLADEIRMMKHKMELATTQLIERDRELEQRHEISYHLQFRMVRLSEEQDSIRRRISTLT